MRHGKAKVGFSSLEEATPEDHRILKPHLEEENRRTPDHVLALFEMQKGDPGPLKVDMYTHGLLTGNYAVDDGADEELVVCALLHDIAHAISRPNHGAVIAEILRPHIRDDYYHMLRHHTVFQGYYSWHHMGLDRNTRDKFRDEPWYDSAVLLASWDQKAFNPDYPARPLDYFTPMVKRFFSHTY